MMESSSPATLDTSPLGATGGNHLTGDFLARFSDEDEEQDDFPASPRPLEVHFEGTISKWTNYLHGWQDRYLMLRDGTLSYFRSEFDTGYGCRGSVSIGKASIEVHEQDDCRFDVLVSDCVYYLRASEPSERTKWVHALDSAKQVESGYGSETQLGKAISTLSLASHTSLASTTSSQKSASLREKLMEMETYKDILNRQIDTMQSYFDACADSGDNTVEASNFDIENSDELYPGELSATPTAATFINQGSLSQSNSPQHKCNSVDFRGEAMTFKATTTGLLQVLSHCIDMMVKREDQWKGKLEREKDKCKKLAEQMKLTNDEQNKKVLTMKGPDFVEGPHSKLNEEEWFDAVETALDEESDIGEEITLERGENIAPPKPTNELMSAPKHRLGDFVEDQVSEHLATLSEPYHSEESGWYMVYEDEELLQVFRKDIEIDGVVCDPLRATYVIDGVSGREVCHYFFDKDVRLDWEVSVEKVKLVEKLSENTNIQHQWHKRIWPSSQRDSCFLSHIRQLSKEEEGALRTEKEIGQAWMVFNKSLDHPDGVDGKCVRALITCAMVCQTVQIGEIKSSLLRKGYTRENVGCRMTYMAQVNPGGWAPPSVVRQVSKREYPKFLRKFSQFMQAVTKDKPLMV